MTNKETIIQCPCGNNTFHIKETYSQSGKVVFYKCAMCERVFDKDVYKHI